jgi:hypothetical protein
MPTTRRFPVSPGILPRQPRCKCPRLEGASLLTRQPLLRSDRTVKRLLEERLGMKPKPQGHNREQFEAFLGIWSEENLEDFLRRPAVRTLDVTRTTAEVFGVVKHQLAQAGRPLPINDVWIAAHALESGSWLITYDRHFMQVPGLLLWDKLG